MDKSVLRGSIWVNTLAIGEDRYGKCLYCSLWDICAPTEEDLKRITFMLLRQGLFTFENNGRHVGIDPRTRLEYTYDDGEINFSQIIKVAKFIKTKNKSGDYNIKIKLNRCSLLKDGIYDTSTDERLDVETANKVIDIYIAMLRKVLAKYECEDVIDIKAQGQLHPDIQAELDAGCIYINLN